MSFSYVYTNFPKNLKAHEIFGTVFFEQLVAQAKPTPKDYRNNFAIENNLQYYVSYQRGEKNYIYGAYKSYEHFKENFDKLKDEEKRFHEGLFCDPNAKCKLFCDIDLEKKQTKLSSEDIIEHVSDAVKYVYKRLEMKHLVKNERWLCSSNSKKHSFHLIINDLTIATSEIDMHKMFWEAVKEVLANIDIPLSKSIDMAVYGKSRQFRMKNCTKFGEKRFLLPLDGDNFPESDYSIQIHSDVIEVVGMKEFMKYSGLYENVELPEKKEEKLTFDFKEGALEFLLDNLPDEFFNEYPKWRNVAWVIINTVEDYETALSVFDTFSAKSKKYDKNSVETAFERWSEQGGFYVDFRYLINSLPLEKKKEFYNKFNNEYTFHDLCKLDGKEVSIKQIRKMIKSAMVHITLDGNPMWAIKKRDEHGFLSYNLVKSKEAMGNYKQYVYEFKNEDFDEKKPEHYKTNPSTLQTTLSKQMNATKAKIMKRTIDFRPELRGKKEEKDLLNLFTGYTGENTSPCDLKVIEPMLNHIREVFANGNEKDYNWIMSWLAYMIKGEKTKRTDICLVLVSPQGCGKNIVYNFLSNYVFGKYYCTRFNDFDKFTGKFNSNLMGKIFTVLDECTSSMHMKEKCDKFKGMIDESVITIEYKGKEPIEVNNHNNFLLFSNHRTNVRIEESDRRFQMFECSEKYRGDRAYFENLDNAMMNDEAGKHFYAYLRDYDISGWSKKVYDTELKLENKMNCDPLKIFVEECKETIKGRIQSKILFDKYIKWCQENNYKFTMNSRTFGIQLEKVHKIKKVKSGNVYYVFGDEVEISMMD